ncbi:cyclodeaminase/cyclohydrolase family protein [Anaerococcus vaginalis]|uniref:cyclodeaminase/cyclohydrolase family protein n=1 Tax=Anaerococcus vaginalis TaxID=33037 RepID=UPI002900CBCB|nr:cyclodeaminase/cyclohydrolase family protein [Anaerococcus vaginalis]MDU2374695.1 cyclodeaminase/cyclohydrolase family protein [Anaerococcus vaginalis]MDU5252805.1 cyclodeaminase/cyclohydrolase family protein [Anaerococcus vaginalis]MDU5342536.1 cyclodeaminase/cyclohydrolase family protein [Anaerococcus vaginalis]MDU5461213.1 cyclodeaminase/cyclohydrolase family protein [Anaerococcus vaginalis]MDU6782331.1 cyclodeaminase/cyclohydrolase family protein [Anaerococcus vaginalis]
MEKNKMIDFSVDHLIENTRKKTANPGGGAITSLVGNLGLNLILMMAKKDYKDEKLNKKSKKIEDKFKKYSEELKELMQEDIDKVNLLIKAYKNKEIKNYDDYIIEANKAPKRTIELMIIVMQDCDFILKYGNIDAISDGEIGLRLVKESIHSSFINLILNEENITDPNHEKTNYKSIINFCDKLYKDNMKIIEEREKKWDK